MAITGSVKRIEWRDFRRAEIRREHRLALRRALAEEAGGEPDRESVS